MYNIKSSNNLFYLFSRYLKTCYDVVVIGGGHAAIEACSVSSKIGASTLMITINQKKIGHMSCNPSLGGVGKGILIKEIDALGGLMALGADYSGIHFRILNRSKGTAVHGPRAQIDRSRYQEFILQTLFNSPNLTLIEDEVTSIDVDKSKKYVKSITLASQNQPISCRSIVVCTGTFLTGIVHIGKRKILAGRIGEPPSNLLAKSLKSLGFSSRRFKTSTPPRLSSKNIIFDKMIKQNGDNPPCPFSFLNQSINHVCTQHATYICHTNTKTHQIVRHNLSSLPQFTENEGKGIGPRYCLSIEGKVMRFIDRDAHQIWIEPDNASMSIIYPAGLNTGLPPHVQKKVINSINGLEKAILIQPGYAIEYDCYDPTNLKSTLETKLYRGLFFAGQINGTTGYEEAAAQGILAGINAALYSKTPSINNNENLTLDRADGYLGVMIDDLITRGINEPYRIFTSRSEYRLHCRADNADQRLTPLGYQIGSVSFDRWSQYQKKFELIKTAQQSLSQIKLSQSQWKSLGVQICESQRIRSFEDVLNNPSISFNQIIPLLYHYPEFISTLSIIDSLPPDHRNYIISEIRYTPYLVKTRRNIEMMRKHENLTLPEDITWSNFSFLSTEENQVLTKFQPKTIGEINRLSGMTPSSVLSLYSYFYRVISMKK